jgi:DNA-binding PucR family transcriptional regulator
MPIQTVDHWEEKARRAEEMAEAMGHAPARFAMIESARLYRNLAEQTRKLTEAREAGAR